MLFLKPAASKRRLIDGLTAGVADDPRPLYFPLKNNGTGTTARAGIAFPANDWLLFPDGNEYLANVGGSAQLLYDLAVLRQKHLTAVGNLLDAVADNRVEESLNEEFSCPN